MSAADLSPTSKQVLEALCEAAEGESYNGDWRDVYLDNAYAKLKDAMSVKSFRSHLASLSKAGFYKVVDGYAFGAVKDEAFQVVS
jgi:hypothetical protein